MISCWSCRTSSSIDLILPAEYDLLWEFLVLSGPFVKSWISRSIASLSLLSSSKILALMSNAFEFASRRDSSRATFSLSASISNRKAPASASTLVPAPASGIAQMAVTSETTASSAAAEHAHRSREAEVQKKRRRSGAEWRRSGRRRAASAAAREVMV